MSRHVYTVSFFVAVDDDVQRSVQQVGEHIEGLLNHGICQDGLLDVYDMIVVDREQDVERDANGEDVDHE